MNLNDLTTLQKKYLRLLLYTHVYHSNPINAELIASRMNRHVSTVRRHIQSLVHMQLAESIPGPNGGYKPTTVAYNLIRLDNKIEPKSVEVQYNSGSVEIEVIDFNINNAENLTNCRVEMYIENDVENFSNGDRIEIDIPTDPRLRIEGEIELLNPVTNQLLANVDSFLISTE